MKIKLSTYIVSLLFILQSNGYSYGQTSINYVPIGRVDSLKQDFNVFKSSLENNYPSLYRYNNKEQIDALLDSCYSTLDNHTTEAEFLKTLKFICSALKDGHLYCGSSPLLTKYIDVDAKLFPLKLHFIDDKAFVLSSTDTKIVEGTEITSINNKSIDQIRTEIFSHIVSDGNIESKKYHIINSVFGFYYFIVYGEQSSFTVSYKTNDITENSIELQSIASEYIPEVKIHESSDLLNLSFVNNIAILKIKSFDIDDLAKNNEDFPAFLENVFKIIKETNTDRLIIDLRDNGGGRGLYGSLLYSYLTNKPFKYYKSLTAATSTLPYKKFNRYSTSFNDMNISMLERKGKKRFLLRTEANNNLKIVQPSENNFSGNIWFITNGLSFSSTAEFSAIAKSNNRGIFIGEETGGGYYGNTSGVMYNLTLPNSGITCSFGLIEFEMAVAKIKIKDHGIIPDYRTIPTINDVISNNDVQLKQALKLAEGNQL